MGTFIAVVRRRAINSRAHTHSYHAAMMLNQIRRGHVLAKKWGGHGCPCRPYAAAPETGKNLHARLLNYTTTYILL